MLQTLPEQDLTTYLERQRVFGEYPAMQWLLAKYGNQSRGATSVSPSDGFPLTDLQKPAMRVVHGARLGTIPKPLAIIRWCNGAFSAKPNPVTTEALLR